VDIAITLVLVIALVVGIDTAARTVKPPLPSPPVAGSTGKIIVDLDRRD
jgi:hypothetical protein